MMGVRNDKVIATMRRRQEALKQ